MVIIENFDFECSKLSQVTDLKFNNNDVGINWPVVYV